MGCHIEWNTSKVEDAELTVSLQPAPDFAFMVEFDRVSDRHNQPTSSITTTTQRSHAVDPG